MSGSYPEKEMWLWGYIECKRQGEKREEMGGGGKERERERALTCAHAQRAAENENI